MKTARVLDDTTNRVVVLVEGRSYPGLVLQGDQLAGLIVLAEDGPLKEELSQLMDHYRQVCKDNVF